ncbi:MAG: NADH-quinone oxidoreductase subunit C [Microthrixaceae bacterium]
MSDATTETSLPYQDVAPGAVSAAEKGLLDTSLIVAPDKLGALATHLRDHEGYDLLSNLTGVDYLGFKDRTAADRFEVVYHLYSTTKGGGPKVLKVRLPEDNPTVPSLMPVYPGADLQEPRGLRPVRHPLRRPPQPAAHSAVGGLQRPSYAQRLAGGLFRG